MKDEIKLMLVCDDASTEVDLGLGAGGSADVVLALRQAFPGLRLVHPRAAPPRPALSGRESEVLTLLAKGLGYPEISRVLGLRLGTVQTFVKRLYRKLDVNSKAEAAISAVSLGLV